MPSIPVYEQLLKGFNSDRQRVTVYRARYSFAPIADFTEGDRGELPGDEPPPPNRILWYGRGGERAIWVKIPVDARLVTGPNYAAVHWPRSPLGCRLVKQFVAFGADGVLRIAREGLRAENGDTFEILESFDESRNSTVQLQGGPGQRVGGCGVSLDRPREAELSPDVCVDADPTARPAVNQDARPEEPSEHSISAEVPGEESRERALDSSAGPHASHLQQACGLSIPFDELGVEVLAPVGAELVGYPEAPTLKLSGISIAVGCLVDLARLGRYGLSLGELPAAAPSSVPVPAAVPPISTAYKTETLAPERSTRRKTDLVGQLTFF